MGFLLNRERVLFDAPSPNGRVMVKENWYRRWLCFDEKFVQTIISKRQPFNPQLIYIRALSATVQQNDSILLLGLGGGAAVHYLEKHCPSAAIHAVEFNPVVIQVAKTFFNVNIPVTCDTAESFLQHSGTFSRIFVDIYTSDEDDRLNPALLQSCFEKARDSVSINLLFNNHEQLLQSITRCREQFSNRTLCLVTDGKSNIVLHGFKRKNYHDEIKQLTADGRVKKLNWDANYGLIGTLNR